MDFVIITQVATYLYTLHAYGVPSLQSAVSIDMTPLRGEESVQKTVFQYAEIPDFVYESTKSMPCRTLQKHRNPLVATWVIYSEELEIEGVVHYSDEENLWTAEIDWNAIQEVEPLVSEITSRVRNIAR